MLTDDTISVGIAWRSGTVLLTTYDLRSLSGHGQVELDLDSSSQMIHISEHSTLQLLPIVAI